MKVPSPFKYRPEKDGLDWENNAASNFMAWASDKFLPKWCKSDTHWTARLADKFWAECSCCLFWRGAAFGGLIVAIIAGVISAVM